MTFFERTRHPIYTQLRVTILILLTIISQQSFTFTIIFFFHRLRLFISFNPRNQPSMEDSQVERTRRQKRVAIGARVSAKVGDLIDEGGGRRHRLRMER